MSSPFQKSFSEKSPLSNHRFDHVIDPETEELVKQFRKNKKDWEASLEKSLKDKTPENRKTRDSLYRVYEGTARKINKLKMGSDIPNDVSAQLADGFDF
jgi:hypothetical protein